MSIPSDLSTPDFLTRVLNLPLDTRAPASIYTGHDPSHMPTPLSPDPARPYVTVTFAQSLDAKIAGTGGSQLALSGRESLVMTHWQVQIPHAFWMRISDNQDANDARCHPGGNRDGL
ncbi:hypothetical protein AcW2_000365 [Taiwanofungus camphoratus]|nr:hypothetical protein AcW2_000365 [Antrodia cinnamomea]